jgi:hypothetical protein
MARLPERESVGWVEVRAPRGKREDKDRAKNNFRFPEQEAHAVCLLPFARPVNTCRQTHHPYQFVSSVPSVSSVVIPFSVAVLGCGTEHVGLVPRPTLRLQAERNVAR